MEGRSTRSVSRNSLTRKRYIYIQEDYNSKLTILNSTNQTRWPGDECNSNDLFYELWEKFLHVQSRAHGKHWQKSAKSSEGTTGDILLLFLECQQFQFLKWKPTDILPTFHNRKPLSYHEDQNCMLWVVLWPAGDLGYGWHEQFIEMYHVLYHICVLTLCGLCE